MTGPKKGRVTGGHHQYPVFAAYESLAREAVASTSPFYRFLCAFRLYDGIGHLRRWIKEAATRLSIKTKLPSDPLVDIDLLKRLGFNEEFIHGIKTANDLRGKFTLHRDRIAHFLLKRSPVPLHFSDGLSCREYALAGGILLYYSYVAFKDLFVYFNQEIEHHTLRGSILPEAENKNMFVIKAESYFPQATPELEERQ